MVSGHPRSLDCSIVGCGVALPDTFLLALLTFRGQGILTALGAAGV